MMYGIFTTEGVIYYGTESECKELVSVVGGQVDLYNGPAR